MSVPYYVEAPPDYYRIVSGYHLQTQRQAENIARDHQKRTSETVIFVHRPKVFSVGMPFHIYALSSRR